MEISKEELKDILSALESFVVSMDYSEEKFEGHNEAYRNKVCLPRAKEILNRIDYPKLKEHLWKK